jgi:hypothetical protein
VVDDAHQPFPNKVGNVEFKDGRHWLHVQHETEAYGRASEYPEFRKFIAPIQLVLIAMNYDVKADEEGLVAREDICIPNTLKTYKKLRDKIDLKKQDPFSSPTRPRTDIQDWYIGKAVEVYVAYTKYERDQTAPNSGTHEARDDRPSWRSPEEFEADLLTALSFYYKFTYFNIMEYGEANEGPDHTKAAAVMDADHYLNAYFANNPDMTAHDITLTNLGAVLAPKQQLFTHQWLEEQVGKARHHWIETGHRPNGKQIFKAQHEKQVMELLHHCLVAFKLKFRMAYPGSTDYIIPIQNFLAECKSKKGPQVEYKRILQWIEDMEYSDPGGEEKKKREEHESRLQEEEEEKRKVKEARKKAAELRRKKGRRESSGGIC